MKGSYVAEYRENMSRAMKERKIMIEEEEKKKKEKEVKIN